MLFFCHDLKRTNGNKIAVDVATIAVCANCVERLMPLILQQGKQNATSAEITPAKGAFVANVKPEHIEQRALKNFFRRFATNTNATTLQCKTALTGETFAFSRRLQFFVANVCAVTKRVCVAVR